MTFRDSAKLGGVSLRGYVLTELVQEPTFGDVADVVAFIDMSSRTWLYISPSSSIGN